MRIETDGILIVVLAILALVMGVWWQFASLLIWLATITITTAGAVVVFGGVLVCVAGAMTAVVYFQQAKVAHQISASANQMELQRKALELAEMQLRIERLAQSPIVLEQIKSGHSLAVSDGHHIALHHNPKPAKQLSQPAIEPAMIEAARLVNDLDIVQFIKANHHYWLNGITGDGKTTLCIEFLNQIRLPYPSANVAILDPKNSADWPIEPICTNVNQVVPLLTLLCDDLQNRVDNQDYNSEPVIVVVDEHDWLKDELGKDYLAKVRYISKVGRQLNYHILVMGQSPLTGDNGLSQSSLNNFGRVIFGNEGLKMLSSGSFPFKTIKADLMTQLEQGIADGLRVALIWPSTKELPYVAEIPHLENDGFDFEAKPIELLPSPSDDDQLILDTFDQLNTNGKPPTPYSIYKAIYGTKPSGGKATLSIKQTLENYGRI